MNHRSALPIVLLSTALLNASPAANGESVPQPVSPGAVATWAGTEDRCPTFSWAGVPSARGYELAVYLITGDEAEPPLVTRVTLPRDARAWTPSSSQCLERGERYAWSIAAVAAPGKELAWSAPVLFEIDAAPTADEVERAVSTLRRFLANRGDIGSDRAADAAAVVAPPRAGATEPIELARPELSPAAGPGEVFDSLPGPLSAPTTGAREVPAATSPTLGAASLSVTSQVHLAAASAVFKEDLLFLWDDGAVNRNLALGTRALSTLSSNATDNTAVGSEALRFLTGGTGVQSVRNTALGASALRATTIGFSNTATGTYALAANTTGERNTASGAFSLLANVDGDFNTAIGYNALRASTTGTRNTALGAFALVANTGGLRNSSIGYRALRNTTGSDNIGLGYRAGFENLAGDGNIFIASEGLPGEANLDTTIRIGTQGTHTRTFVGGISGVNVSGAAVLVNANGQLGVNLSTRAHKQDIQDLEPFAERLLALRPVAFRYKEHAAADPAAPVEFGLIAEEVAEVLPELVLYGEDGKPLTVKYHLLSSLLLGELQQQDRRVAMLQAELAAVRRRLAALESQPRRGERERKK